MVHCRILATQLSSWKPESSASKSVAVTDEVSLSWRILSQEDYVTAQPPVWMPPAAQQGPYLGTSMLQRKQRSPFAPGQHQRHHHILVGGFHRKVIPHNWLVRGIDNEGRALPAVRLALARRPASRKTCCQRGGRRTRGTWPMVTRPGCYRNQVSAYDQLGWVDWRYNSVQQNLSRLICHWNPGWGVHPGYDSRVFFWMISEYLYKPCFRGQQEYGKKAGASRKTEERSRLIYLKSEVRTWNCLCTGNCPLKWLEIPMRTNFGNKKCCVATFHKTQ